jgi:uncharacterized membrane protein
MINFNKLLISAILFVVLDSIYLNLIKDYFLKQIYLVQKSPIKIDFLAILLCYMFLIFGINYFIIQPNRSILDAFILGIIIYGVYETTNKALLLKWSWLTVFMDTLWGGILFALTTYLIKYYYI